MTATLVLSGTSGFGTPQQGFGLGTAVVRGLGAQTLDSRLEPVEGGEVRVCGHGSVPNKTRPRDRLGAALNLMSERSFLIASEWLLSLFPSGNYPRIVGL